MLYANASFEPFQSMWRWIVAGLLAATLSAQQFQFVPMPPRTPESWLSVTGAMTGIAAGDINGDARHDIVVTEGSQAEVCLRTAVGWNVTRIPVSVQAQLPVVRDLDGDGDGDLLFVPHSPTQPSRLVIVRNLGAQGFQERFLPGLLPPVVLTGASIGDVDSDGDADIVIVPRPNQSQPPVLLLRNDGTGTFAPDASPFPASVPTDCWPALVDADGDGKLDLLLSGSGAMMLLRNNAGAFVDASATLPQMPGGLAFATAADVDGDGHADVVVVHAGGAVDLLFGGPSGFVRHAAVATAVGARRVMTGDVDGDGDLDLVTEALLACELARNLGNRAFAREVLLADGIVTSAVDDVDGDGTGDLLLVRSAAPQSVSLFAAADGRRADAAVVHGPRLPSRRPVLGDVDGDGRQDVVNHLPGALLTELSAGGRYIGRLSAVTSPSLEPGGHLLLVDLDGDGDRDLVMTTNQHVAGFANDGTGAFTPLFDLPVGVLVGESRAADLDADGDQDIVASGFGGIGMLRNPGNGVLSVVTVLANGTLNVPLFALADVDGDGDQDIVSQIPRPGGGHSVLGNDGAGQFAFLPLGWIDLGPPSAHLPDRSLVAVDLDRDGDMDLVGDTGMAQLQRNNGAGHFTNVTTTNLPTNLTTGEQRLHHGDLDGDGHVDLYSFAADGSGVMRVLSNDGSGRFLTVTTTHMAAGCNCSVAAPATDLDADGDVDLLLFDGSRVQVFGNRLRHVRCLAVPHLGGIVPFEIASSPGSGQAGVAWLVAAPAVTSPQPLPGVAGGLQLDAASAFVVDVVATSTVGVASSFVSVPSTTQLAGMRFWYQAALVPATGPPALTNVGYEVILP